MQRRPRAFIQTRRKTVYCFYLRQKNKRATKARGTAYLNPRFASFITAALLAFLWRITCFSDGTDNQSRNEYTHHASKTTSTTLTLPNTALRNTKGNVCAVVCAACNLFLVSSQY